MQLKIILTILSSLSIGIEILHERSQIIYFERGCALLEKKIVKNSRRLEVKKKELNESMAKKLYKNNLTIEKQKTINPAEA